MLDIEQSLLKKFPGLSQRPALVRQSTATLLRKLTREQEINAFLREHPDQKGMEFVDRIFEYFNFSYTLSAAQRANIPAQGRVIIIANHPIGSLDGLALLRLVSEVRSDVKVLANDMLMAFEPLRDCLLALDNMTGRQTRRSYRSVMQALEAEQAVIIFPAGSVSRMSPRGVRDGTWQGGFLHFARKSGAPVLPVHIEARNSLMFYGTSLLFKPFSTALLAREMFNKQSSEIRFRIGEAIPADTLAGNRLTDKALIRRLKKHLYKIGKDRRAIFVTEKTVAHPESRLALKRELASAQCLHSQPGRPSVYLCEQNRHPAVLREIGRLRELAFRKIGAGTGKRRDLDRYDASYHHLVLWNDTDLEVVGAYRVGDLARILPEQGLDGVYSAELFRYQPTTMDLLHRSVELGRSFIHPAYWGQHNYLDELWRGLGTYLQQRPHIRFVVGPVSMSNRYPRELREMLVFYYQRYYQTPNVLAGGRYPYFIEPANYQRLVRTFRDLSAREALAHMQAAFANQQCQIPTLFRQYASLYHPGGYQLLAFSVDSDFGDCLDGLFIGDLTRLKPAKRRRYMPSTLAEVGHTAEATAVQ